MIRRLNLVNIERYRRTVEYNRIELRVSKEYKTRIPSKIFFTKSSLFKATIFYNIICFWRPNVERILYFAIYIFIISSIN